MSIQKAVFHGGSASIELKDFATLYTSMLGGAKNDLHDLIMEGKYGVPLGTHLSNTKKDSSEGGRYIMGDDALLPGPMLDTLIRNVAPTKNHKPRTQRKK